MKIAAAPLGPFETNAYLVVAENGKDCCVVDAPKDAGPLLLGAPGTPSAKPIARAQPSRQGQPGPDAEPTEAPEPG